MSSEDLSIEVYLTPSTFSALLPSWTGASEGNLPLTDGSNFGYCFCGYSLLRTYQGVS